MCVTLVTCVSVYPSEGAINTHLSLGPNQLPGGDNASRDLLALVCVLVNWGGKIKFRPVIFVCLCPCSLFIS